MICQVCKEDHRTLVNNEWCDRSLLEIENDYLKAENARLREALEFYAWTCEPTKIQRSDNSGTLVMVEDKEKALARYNEDLFLFGNRAREALKDGE
jgi:hypothetical protein